jgi:hypothetical protein
MLERHRQGEDASHESDSCESKRFPVVSARACDYDHGINISSRGAFAMQHSPRILPRLAGLAAGLFAAAFCLHAAAQSATVDVATASPVPALRDGAHDFDFEIGNWHTHLKRLPRPLSGSKAWVEYDGTTVVSKVWGGRANMVELEVDGAEGHIEALSLRLYNPDARQWSLNFAGSGSGSMGQPTIGEFKDGRGEFYDQESYEGRAIFVRFVITVLGPDACHFEQAFSDDGGKTWEVNWIADDTRAKGAK